MSHPFLFICDVAGAYVDSEERKQLNQRSAVRSYRGPEDKLVGTLRTKNGCHFSD